MGSDNRNQQRVCGCVFNACVETRPQAYMRTCIPFGIKQGENNGAKGAENFLGDFATPATCKPRL